MASHSSVPFWTVNAFTTGDAFSGNPAAVVLLKDWLPDSVLQAIAAQHNLSETAFVVMEGAGWRLRWFTPVCEVDLCGHATLATAAVLFEIGAVAEQGVFHTRSGPLSVRRGSDGLFWMDFPAKTAEALPVSEALTAVFGPIEAVARNALDYLLVELSGAEAVTGFKPEMGSLRAIDAFGIIVTAPGGGAGIDFVSRFFAPRAGVAEDPVTGSAHCTLFPWWGEKLGQRSLRARQCSSRGGLLSGDLGEDDRVHLGGQAKIFARGELWTSG
jgi:predicted PhzF superfamily epimerase YddE/YHI9